MANLGMLQKYLQLPERLCLLVAMYIESHSTAVVYALELLCALLRELL